MIENFLAAVSGEQLDALYRKWQRSEDSVPEEWRFLFSGFELGMDLPTSLNNKFDETAALKLSGVQSLIYRYRSIGHLIACTDPLSSCRISHPQLELSNFGLEERDLEKQFVCRRFIKERATLAEILNTMRETYCREIGVEFMHIENPDERQWLIDRMEPSRNHPNLTADEKLHILEMLHKAALFEAFLHRRFIGQKRFSLEGGEILIPVMDRIVSSSPESGITDIVMGMSHRGRLNVLAHILHKPYQTIFAEFRELNSLGFTGDGDVKYHKGYSSDVDANGKSVHITIAANPSHLEAVNAVVEGKSRARQDRYGTNGNSRVLPLLIHGDAAFAGQGSVMEVLNMSGLAGYSTGGTIHLVLNNQIGFTTLPKDARSTNYATDVAKMLSCPIFHVQGESPEAAMQAVGLAMEYRREFKRDVVIELICYRRHGHNEGDEPAFTQPKMYGQIAARTPVNFMYAAYLAKECGISANRLEMLEQNVNNALETAFNLPSKDVAVGFADRWSDFQKKYVNAAVETEVATEKLVTLARRLAALPASFSPHKKIETLIQKRFEAVLKGVGIDWGNAETLAYATLLDQGYSVRLSGQDSQRGTFNHRHCVLVDGSSEYNYKPLESVAREGAVFQVWNSLLSEFGVMGFEYGYSLENPKCLTIWEAQFGDFANGAQVVIDQFISSGETKWNRASGLILLLPHGYEGQGAEHSSARIERFLQLCANENMFVVCPSTPAQMFHLLRRQMLQTFRKPLIVFTPKSLLRNPLSVSSISEFSEGSFKKCIVSNGNISTARQLLFCSGKIFYELQEELVKAGVVDTVIVRIEQLYPLDTVELLGIVELCNSECRFSWVQEEPENMGAWYFVERQFRKLSVTLNYIGRAADSCPAVGSHHINAEQQIEIIGKAFMF
ncbi:MAG: 2-oxoglutarate dehydrogenase E1 component [Desulfuromonadaceae bacterium]|nr:2-oxoglutarate dehydrogenase E1 component [Desulfuromonadaceae bacterium]MDD2855516.1 2-oxoglutarate dehydrogenase E1 component [Desulfuromonadaceae bacterium]